VGGRGGFGKKRLNLFGLQISMLKWGRGEKGRENYTALVLTWERQKGEIEHYTTTNVLRREGHEGKSEGKGLPLREKET